MAERGGAKIESSKGAPRDRLRGTRLFVTTYTKALNSSLTIVDTLEAWRTRSDG